MTSPIAFNNSPASLVFSGGVARVVVNGEIVPIGSFVHVCCYCFKDKRLQTELLNAGYQVSHGACESCAKRELDAARCKIEREESSK